MTLVITPPFSKRCQSLRNPAAHRRRLGSIVSGALTIIVRRARAVSVSCTPVAAHYPPEVEIASREFITYTSSSWTVNGIRYLDLTWVIDVRAKTIKLQTNSVTLTPARVNGILSFILDAKQLDVKGDPAGAGKAVGTALDHLNRAAAEGLLRINNGAEQGRKANEVVGTQRAIAGLRKKLQAESLRAARAKQSDEPSLHS